MYHGARRLLSHQRYRSISTMSNAGSVRLILMMWNSILTMGRSGIGTFRSGGQEGEPASCQIEFFVQALVQSPSWYSGLQNAFQVMSNQSTVGISVELSLLWPQRNRPTTFLSMTGEFTIFALDQLLSISFYVDSGNTFLQLSLSNHLTGS